MSRFMTSQVSCHQGHVPVTQRDLKVQSHVSTELFPESLERGGLSRELLADGLSGLSTSTRETQGPWAPRLAAFPQSFRVGAWGLPSCRRSAVLLPSFPFWAETVFNLQLGRHSLLGAVPGCGGLCQGCSLIPQSAQLGGGEGELCQLGPSSFLDTCTPRDGT